MEPVLVSPPGPYVARFEALGLRHIPWEVGRKTINPLGELASIRALRRIFQQEQPDLIHQHTNKALLYGTQAARGSGIPLVNSMPGRGYVFSSNKLLAMALRPVVRSMYRMILKPYPRQEMIFENQEDMADFLAHGYIPAERATLIPSVGVDVERYLPGPLPPEPFTVAFVGRMLWDKGVGVFARAAALLNEAKQPVRMVLVGLPDPENPGSVPQPQMEAWHKEGILEWWGWREDMSQVYAQIHALANPTMYGEGVPTTLVEAAASQRGIIATDWAGCREIVKDGETGLLVPPNDPQALAEAVRQMTADRQTYDRLRKNARELAVSAFSTRQVNRQTLEVYQRVLAK